MGLLLCKKCSYLREAPDEYIGKTINCPVCKGSVPIHNTITFVKNIISTYKTLNTKFRQLQTELDSEVSGVAEGGLKDENIDFHNTTAMTFESQYQPIVDWFKNKGVKLNVDTKELDTEGFFDEIAVALGENYQLLKDVNERIRKTQRKGYSSVTLAISNYSQKEVQSLTSYCKQLYDFSFVAKYFYNKSEKRIHLTLQKTTSVVNFFNGIWLEWFVFMKLLILFYEKKIPFSALRSFKVYFSNEDQYEIDVFFLINNRIPIFIECKMGEFRSHIDKYHKLRKRMGIDKKNFVMLVLGLSDEQTKGLTSMYEITFVNENNFEDYFLSLMKDFKFIR